MERQTTPTKDPKIPRHSRNRISQTEVSWVSELTGKTKLKNVKLQYEAKKGTYMSRLLRYARITSVIQCYNNHLSKNFKEEARSLKDNKSVPCNETKEKTKNNHERRFQNNSDSDEEDWSLKVDKVNTYVSRIEVLLRLSNKTVTIGLLDTGSSSSLVARDLLTDENVIRNDNPVKWKTQFVFFETTQTATIPFTLPQFDPKRK